MTTRTDLDFETYSKNREALADLGGKIERLEAFGQLTAVQQRQLDAHQSAFRVLDEHRKSHERACLVAGVSFDGSQELVRQTGHTPKSLDDEN